MRKEMKNQIKGEAKKGRPGDPDYYPKLRAYWKTQGVDLPENPDDIDYDSYPFNAWMTKTVQPKKKAARGRNVRRTNAAEDVKYMIPIINGPGKKNVATTEEMEKTDEVIDKGRIKIKLQNARNQLKWKKRDLQNPNHGPIKKKNIQKKIDELEELINNLEEKLKGL